MRDTQKQELYARNNKIVEMVLKEMQEKCPNAIDLIGIGGSFCNGDFYEKSDLDLVIISNNESAKCLDKCFIIGDIGFDIYTQNWDRFASLAKYTHPYVTKLIDLTIIYSRNEEVLKKYKSYQALLYSNMNNEKLVNKQIDIHFSQVLESLDLLQKVSNIGGAYRLMAAIIKEIEFILFLVNRTYVKRGTKRIPEEIASLKILPQNFLPIYNETFRAKTIAEIKNNALLLIRSIKTLLDSKKITYGAKGKSKDKLSKRTISASDLIGTYEEIYSNWKNKMEHAIAIDSAYLSFITMSACQEFYDEMAMEFDIPRIELLASYNPNDLKGNAIFFDNALNEWKKLYDKLGLIIQYYPSLEEVANLYKENNSLIK